MGFLPVTMGAAELSCQGNETDIAGCRMVEKDSCNKATVVCSNMPISNSKCSSIKFFIKLIDYSSNAALSRMTGFIGQLSII